MGNHSDSDMKIRNDLIRLLEEDHSLESIKLVHRLKSQKSYLRKDDKSPDAHSFKNSIMRPPDDDLAGDDLKDVIYYLTHVRLNQKEALQHWDAMIHHHGELCQCLGRDVGLRLALFDYFINMTKLIKNPKLIEQDEFVDVLEVSWKDPLTGLYNRRYMDHYLKNLVDRAQEYGGMFSIIFFDLDNFKKYNDSFGHQEGDAALKQIGSLLRLNIRTDDVIMRYAGEEFLLVMPHTHKEDAVELGKRLKENVEHYCQEHLKRFTEGHSLTVSGGVATFPDDGVLLDDLIKRADVALYIAKRAGKNQICEYYMEKRNYPRNTMASPVVFRFVEQGEYVELTGHVKNVGKDGILFETQKELPFGRDVEFDFQLVEDYKQVSYKTIGRVVRSIRSSQRNNVEIAAVFSKVHQKQYA